MKTMAKIALGALMTCGVAAAAPADAAVRVGVGIGAPIGPALGLAYYGGPPCYAYPNPYCGYPAYYGPGFVGAYWGGRGDWGHGGWGHGGGHGGWGHDGGHGGHR